MKIDARELDAILRRKWPRRQMRLPVEWDEHGVRVKCPAVEKRTLALTDGERGVRVTVTGVARSPHGAIGKLDAEREGYGSIDMAIAAWTERHGDTDPNRPVWVIDFIVGDASALLTADEPILLARGGGYTHSTARAIPDEPEVMLVPGAGERARVEALMEQIPRQEQSLQDASMHVGACRESLASMKARKHVANAERELAKAVRVLSEESDSLTVAALPDIAPAVDMGDAEPDAA